MTMRTMRWVWLLALLCGLPTAAQAHRLDQYLQATTLAVLPGKVELRMSLTPGVSVAPGLLAVVDRDGDGALSPAEQQAYAGAVEHDLSLTVDGAQVPLRLLSARYPAEQTMREGLGDIVLTFEAPWREGDGVHHLVLANRHDNAVAVRLVNTLVPQDRSVHITGQERSLDQSVYRLDFRSGGADTQAVQSSSLPLVGTFFRHGVHHILTGYDHLLFGLALVLGAASLWDLLAVVTVFTLAHSITLTLAALGLVHVPGALVEPVISGSIVFVALQNLYRPSEARGRGRLMAAFLFGLFHGLGFAGGLLDLMHQMPRHDVLLAIAGFSLGVEAGNQIVLLPAFAVLMALRRISARERDGGAPARLVGSAAISVAGMYYLGVALTGV